MKDARQNTVCSICGEGPPVSNSYGTHSKCWKRVKWARSVIPPGTDIMAAARKLVRAEQAAYEQAAAAGFIDEIPHLPELTPGQAVIKVAYTFHDHMPGSEQRNFRWSKGMSRMGRARPVSAAAEKFI